MGGTTDDNAIKGTATKIFERFMSCKEHIINYILQRKCKTVQKLEGATQKSLDEEIKSTDNIPIEFVSQKPKAVDEDPEQVIPSDTQQSTTKPIFIKKDSKMHNVEEKDKCSCSAGISANATQNEQSVNAQEKDAVDSAVEVATVTPESVTSNDKINGTQ